MARVIFLFALISVVVLQCHSVRPVFTEVDKEIMELSEKLFSASSPNIFNQIRINLQEKTRSYSKYDDAAAPLLTVNETTLARIPTIVKLRALFDNYNLDTEVSESVTQSNQQEEWEFLEKVIDTPVMKLAMKYLNGKIGVGNRERQINLLHTIWFSLYPRGRHNLGSSGFEHVFMTEINKQSISGLHNWIYFHDHESKSHDIDYKGYIRALSLGNKALLLKYRLSYKKLTKPVTSMFIGTLPEFEMALYTVCFQMRKQMCHVSLAGKKFIVHAFPLNYKGKRLVGSAYPEF